MNLGISVNKKVILVSTFTECLILGGPTYGWPSLVYVLRDRGYFSDQCLNHTQTLNDRVEYGVHGYPTCAEQDARLQLVFIIGAFGLNTSALIFGLVYDKFGIRLSRIFSSIFILLACLLFAFSGPATSYLSFMALYLLATGGAILLITNSQLSTCFICDPMTEALSTHQRDFVDGVLNHKPSIFMRLRLRVLESVVVDSHEKTF
ncbi:solute carrier family 43 member 3-like [Anneissia japonica]|uniref:solute carrier family 43 member 3-like n=1 Tax=Anneissia japonica TaxID=1529436 RepID=UPI001425538A|nr:solute carrier family 43 member 3-like [Anneissia japonica]